MSSFAAAGAPSALPSISSVAMIKRSCERHHSALSASRLAQRSKKLTLIKKSVKCGAPSRSNPSTKMTPTGPGLAILAATCCLALLAPQLSTHPQALAAASPPAASHTDAPVQSTRYLNYLLFSNGGGGGVSQTADKQQQQQQQQPANEELMKVEKLLKDTNHSHISDAVNIQLANSIWQKMHQNALQFAKASSQSARPTINQLLEQASVSGECKGSLNDMLDHLSNLDQWAIEMWNSFGDFPSTGFYEGSLSSMGSYTQCVNVKQNEWIGKPQYCTFKFQPIVPKRPRYHNILAPISNLANFTSNDDMFNMLAKKAQYFYYLKLRLATCMPSKCSQRDLDSIGERVAINTYLQFQGVQCLQKAESFSPDASQWFCLIILIAMASVSILGTLVHMLNVRSLFEARSPLSKATVDLTLTKKSHNLHHNVVVGVHGFNNNNNENNNNNNAKTDPIQPQVKVGANNNNNNLASEQHHHLLHNQKGLNGSILATPVVIAPVISDGTSSSVSYSKVSSRAIRAIDFLMHFSILKNGRKLFDTTTSRRGNNRTVAGSLVPSMPVDSSSSAGIGSTNCSSSSTTSGSGTISRSDSSSVDGQSNDIGCVHGLRFWTISWIILGHTMQYTEWAGFGRAYQIEQHITSFMLHPLLNATFSVDTFFLISGLLTTYVTWTITRGHYWRFNKFAFLISRYLRLMPQVLIVILMFIVFPLFGDGPHWKGIVEKESENCKQNWWVSALFLQSFYRQDQICNLVTWWLSIEMFFHFTSIFVIIALLHSARKGLITALVMGGGLTSVSCYLHYVNAYPPNMLPTVLQRYEVWDSIVLKYFWTPYPHAPSYFVGLLLGYALYNRSINQLSRRQIRWGWTAFGVCYLAILFGTYHWNNNAPYSRLASTAYYNLSQIFWSLATGWAILACALGNGGWLNEFLSSPVFIPLGRATYMTYLSHMLIVMSYPAKMNLLIEPSHMIFVYIFISNLVLSYGLGIVLTLIYESPILHLQKLLVAKMANKFNDDMAPTKNRRKGAPTDGEKSVKVSLYAQQPLQSLGQQPLQQQPLSTTVDVDNRHELMK